MEFKPEMKKYMDLKAAIYRAGLSKDLILSHKECDALAEALLNDPSIEINIHYLCDTVLEVTDE